MKRLSQVSQEVGERLHQLQHVLVTAESCTGGGIASAITDISGSSAWFDRAFVTYSNEAKIEMIGVNPETLVKYGAVSRETVQEMASGALSQSNGSIAISVSGIAGPLGGTADKPVGTVWFAWKMKEGMEKQAVACFSGDRQAVREQACIYALEGLLALICEK